MSLHDFWTGVWIAADAIMGSPGSDPDDIGRTLFGPGDIGYKIRTAISGFDEGDFAFLPQEERDRLKECVTEILDVLKTTGRRAPTGNPLSKVFTSLGKIIELFNFERYADPEALRLGKLIEQELEDDDEQPPGLAELRFRSGLDHAGEPGLWIRAYLDDRACESDESFLATAGPLREYLRSVARRIVGPDRFPYLSFRSFAEEAEMMETP